MDRGARRAAVLRVTQSQTQLKPLSSSIFKVNLLENIEILCKTFYYGTFLGFLLPVILIYIHTALYSLRCTAYWFDLYTSWSDYHGKFSDHPSSHIGIKEIVKNFSFLMMRTLRIYSVNNFHIQHWAVLIIFIMLCIISLVLIYLIIGSLCLLTAFIQFLFPFMEIFEYTQM